MIANPRHILNTDYAFPLAMKLPDRGEHSFALL